MERRSELIRLQAKFENFVSLTASRATANRYAKALNAFMDKFTDRKSPDEFTRADIQDYVLYRRKDGVSNRTINYEVTILRAFWNWMLRQDIVSWNPASNVKRLREVEPERKALTEAQQIRLYETAAATGRPFDLVLVFLSLSTGLRAQTLVQLEKSDVNFETGVLSVNGAKMKTGRNIEIPLRPALLALLESLPDGRIFEGYARNAAALCYRFNRLLRRAGLGDFAGLRVGRRSFATTLLRSGVDLRIVQELLGHKNIATTSRYLSMADKETTKAALDKLPEPPQATTPLGGEAEGTGSV